MAAQPERVRLADGEEVEIRPIEPDDAEALQAALARLSPDSRYRRFLAPKDHFTATELRYLTDVDHERHEALVAIAPGTREGLGVARFVQVPERPGRAEVGIAVADDRQGRGLGTVLLTRLADRAAQEGVCEFSASVLGSNREVLGLLRKVGPVDVHQTGGGVAELTVGLRDGEPCPPVLREALRAAARGDLEPA